jgi:hypothetical protein
MARRDRVALRRPGDAHRPAAGGRARPGRRRGRDGLPDGGGADPAPALLAPGRRLAGTRGAEALADDRLRRGEGRLSRQHPDRLCARRAHVRAALRGRVPHRDVRSHLRHLPHDALRLGDEARGLRRGELAPERKPRLLVRRRPERGRHPRPDPERACCAAAGRILLHRIGSLPRPDPGGGASARARRGRHVGPDEGGDAFHPWAQHLAPVARVGRDAQLLQLRLRGTLHPLCDPRAARSLGDARDRPRRRRDRRPARGGRGRAPHPSFRDRPHLRLRDGALPGTASARPPGGRAQHRRSRHALQRRVSLWARRHDPRHQRWSDHHGPHSTPVAVPVDRRSALRQLRRAAPRRAGGRRARGGLRPAAYLVVRRGRRRPPEEDPA